MKGNSTANTNASSSASTGASSGASSGAGATVGRSAGKRAGKRARARAGPAAGKAVGRPAGKAAGKVAGKVAGSAADPVAGAAPRHGRKAAGVDAETAFGRVTPDGSRKRAPRETGVDEIHERIYQAILEHRLPPGTKLGEDRMASIFGVSRARVREVFARLAHEGVVELFPQRGAFVAKPTIEQARHVFEMRRLVEPGIVRRLVANLTPDKLARLREHHGRELDARRRDDRRAVIRLSGEFHTMLADLAGNSVLAKAMYELTTLTCLIIFLYDAPTSDACRADEHAAIIGAVDKGDTSRAEALMLRHLDHIEASLDLTSSADEVDLESIFS